MLNTRSVIVPLVFTVTGLLVTIVFSFLYTNWSISDHAHQACSEMNILATAKGATTGYDQTVRREYRSLYALRCK
jgi:hypothetical protein